MTIPADLKKTKLLVVACTSHFFGDDFVSSRLVRNPHGPDLTLEFTSDVSRAGDADALWFHGPHVAALPPRKPGQKRVLMCMESDVNYPALKNPLLGRAFDVLMTYRLDSDVPCVYPNWRDYGTFLDPPPSRTGPSSGSLAVYIASNPVPHRDRYAEALMRYVRVDSLGACLANATAADFVRQSGWAPGAWASILSVLPRYKFYLAFENSITTDYVTERLFHALAAGVVPVYLGAPNVRDFLPHQDAAIVANEFESPQSLATLLNDLDADDVAYSRLLRWKHEGYSSGFRRLVDLGSIDPRDRLAVKLAHGCDRDCACGGRLRQPTPAR